MESRGGCKSDFPKYRRLAHAFADDIGKRGLRFLKKP